MIGRTMDLIPFLKAQPIDKEWELREHRNKRTRNQNSYYWELVGKVAKIASKDGLIAPKIHNLNLRALGLREVIGGNTVFVDIRDSDEAEEMALRSETLHLAPTSRTFQNKRGEMFRTYVMLRGSHSFNTTEMKALLDIMIEEAKAQGIETMTPNQLAEMARLEMEAENEQKRVDTSRRASS